MWRKLLVWGIRAAVSSGLADRAKDWLVEKLGRSIGRVEARIDRDLERLYEDHGVEVPVIYPPEAK